MQSEQSDAVIDQNKIMDAVEKASEAALKKFGAFVRQTAKKSLKKSKGISSPGSPPIAHLGLIGDLMLFAVEMASHNVVIGPKQLNKPSLTALRALEHGGSSLVFRKGMPGGITIAPRPFMQPAFDKEIEKAAYLWQDSVKE